MSTVSPQVLNRRLSRQVFLTEADLPAYADLCGQTQAMLDPGEKFEPPPPHAAGAWSTVYPKHLSLLKRAEARAAKDAELATSNGALELKWQHYLAERSEVLEYLKVQRVDSEILEWCGLTADLLADPIVRGAEGEKFGFPRRKDWPVLADGLNSGWYKFKNLTDAQRADIPRILQTRRFIQMLDSFGKELKTVEEKFTYLDTRLSAVESRLTNPKH